MVPGTHSVKLTKTGYQDWGGNVTIEAGKTTYLSTALAAVSPEAKIPWWLLALGLAAGGGTVYITGGKEKGYSTSAGKGKINYQVTH